MCYLFFIPLHNLSGCCKSRTCHEKPLQLSILDCLMALNELINRASETHFRLLQQPRHLYDKNWRCSQTLNTVNRFQSRLLNPYFAAYNSSTVFARQLTMRHILFLVYLCLPLYGLAQKTTEKDPSRSRNTIYLEGLGSGGIYSINYERLLLLKEKQAYGFRVGTSYFGNRPSNLTLIGELFAL